MKAVGLREAAARVGISYGHAKRLVAEGRFPVPLLPRHGKRSWLKVSEADIDRYLNTAATADAQTGAA